MMRVRFLLALTALVTTACGYSTLDEVLDPVPQGTFDFAMEYGTYDAHFVTVSNTCPSGLHHDFEYSTVVDTQLDGTPYFAFTSPGIGIGHIEGVGHAHDLQIFRNPEIGWVRVGVPGRIDVNYEIWVERAGPGMLQLRFEEMYLDCEHIGRLTLTLRD